MAVNLTLTAGLAVAGHSAASRARRSLPARAVGSIVVARSSPGGARCRSNAIAAARVRSSSSSSDVAMTAVRRASRTTSSVRVAATAGGDAPDPEVDEEEEEEELDTEKLMQELTDTSQLMKRGEVFFVGQMLLIFLLVFVPGGGELESLKTAQKDAFDPLIGLALLALSGVLVVKVSHRYSLPPTLVSPQALPRVLFFVFFKRE